MSSASVRRVVTFLFVVMFCCGWCDAKEKQEVTFTYVVVPKQTLPEGLKAVAVIDSGVRTQGADGDKREAKWSRIAADMIESMLVHGNQLMDPPLSIADRRATKQVLMEQDLKLAGLVEGKTATQAGKLLAVQGLVTSNLTIDIDVRRTRKQTLDWTSLLGNAAGQMNSSRDRDRRGATRTRRYDVRRQGTGHAVYGQPRHRVVPPPVPADPEPAFGTREVEEISRCLAVQCSFSLIDASSGEVILRYAPPVVRKEDRSSPDFLFGQFVDPAELDPADHFIGELVERVAREFVGMLVPVPVVCTYELVGRHDEGEAAIRAVRAEDYAVAYQRFQEGFREDPDEHETVFAMGVVSEIMQQWDQAIAYYRQAAGMDDVDDDELEIYLAARKRLTEHRDRMLPPDSVYQLRNATSAPADSRPADETAPAGQPN